MTPLLERNEQFGPGHTPRCAGVPARTAAHVTCLEPRVDRDILGLQLEDAPSPAKPEDASPQAVID